MGDAAYTVRRRAKLRAAGLCVFCGKRPALERCDCDTCRAKRRKSLAIGKIYYSLLEGREPRDLFRVPTQDECDRHMSDAIHWINMRFPDLRGRDGALVDSDFCDEMICAATVWLAEHKVGPDGGQSDGK